MTEVKRYRKLPVEVEAMHYTGPDDIKPILRWIRDNGGSAHRNLRRFDQVLVIVIDTLEGAVAVSPGGWVVRGVAGEFHPVRGDIFPQSYEPVDGAS